MFQFRIIMPTRAFRLTFLPEMQVYSAFVHESLIWERHSFQRV